jgi:hypothetical protein
VLIIVVATTLIYATETLLEPWCRLIELFLFHYWYLGWYICTYIVNLDLPLDAKAPIYRVVTRGKSLMGTSCGPC